MAAFGPGRGRRFGSIQRWTRASGSATRSAPPASHSAEAYKVGSSTPYVRVPRLFIRPDHRPWRRGAGRGARPQPVGRRSETANRIVATVGMFSVVDVFDTNRYAHDPRNDFLNWAVADSGAFDYAADAWGLRLWRGPRSGTRAGGRCAAACSTGRRRRIQPSNRCRCSTSSKSWWRRRRATRGGGTKRQDQAAGLSDPRQTRHLLGIGAVLRRQSGRQQRGRGGHPPPAQQIRRRRELSSSRLPPDPGFSYAPASPTDAPRPTTSPISTARCPLALSLAGTRWHRPDDTVGVAFVVNTISKAFKDYLEQGGLGVLVGDGKLTNAGAGADPRNLLQLVGAGWASTSVPTTQLITTRRIMWTVGRCMSFGGRVHVQFLIADSIGLPNRRQHSLWEKPPWARFPVRSPG